MVKNERSIKVGMVQIATTKCDIESNFQRSVNLIKMAAKRGADIVCTPECMLDGYAFDTETFQMNPGIYCLTRIHEYIKEYYELARALKIGILVGTSLQDNADQRPRYRNAVLFIDGLRNIPTNIVGEYYKIHSTHKNYEQVFYTPGSKLPVFSFKTRQNVEVKFGVMICFDRQLPETARILAIGGAQIIFNPAATGNFRRSWNTRLLQTRAFENNCFIVSVNHAYPRICGRSLAVNPKGKILKQLPPWQCAQVITCNLNELHKSSLLFTRKPELYTKLIKS